MAKSRGRKFAELVAPTNGVFAAASIPTIALSKLANSTFSVNSESASLGGNVELDSNDITEHSSALYFTNARAQGSLSVAANSGHGALSYDNSNGQFTFAGITTEALQDVVGAMFSSNTETAVTVTYQDSDGTIDLVVDDTTKLPLAGGTMTGNLTLGDNVNAYFGASTDLRIYHDGTNSHIINSTGELRVTGSNIAIKSDSAKLYFGASDDLQIYHNGSHSFISDQGTGHLKLLAGDFRLNNAADNAQMISAVSGGSVYLYDNNDLKLQTSSTGISVSGHIDLDDNNMLKLGTGDDFEIYYDGTDAYIRNHSGGNIIQRARTGFIFQTNATGGGADDAIRAAQNGAVTLYYDGSAKLATTSTGVQTTGTLNVNGAFAFPTSDGTNGQVLQTNGSGVVSWSTAAGGGSVWSSSGSDIYYTSGNVGIGTQNPANPLHVNSSNDQKIILSGSNDPYIRFQEGTTNRAYIQWNAAGYLEIRNSEDSSGVRIDSALTVTPSGDEAIVLQGVSNPYIRFQEGTTNRAYIQWNDAGYLEIKNQETTASFTLGNTFALTPTANEAFLIQAQRTALYQKIYNSSTTGSMAYLELRTINGSSTQNPGYLIKNAGQNSGNSLGNNSLYLWNHTNEIEFVPAGTIAKRTTVDTNGNLTVRGGSTAASGIVGIGYTGYFGLRQADQTLDSEYMIITKPSDHTYITANSGYNVIIRNSANNSTNQLIVGSGANGISWRGNTIWTAENDGASSGLDADLLDGVQGSTIQQALARNAGWEPGYSNTDEASVYYDYSERAIVIDGANDPSNGAVFKAVRLEAGDQVRFTVQIKGNTANSSGMYIRLYAYNGELPAGKTHVSNAASSSTFVQEDSSGDTGWHENGSIGASYVSYTRTYTASQTQFVSLVVLNWSNHGNNKLYVRNPDIAILKVNDSNALGGSTAGQYMKSGAGDVVSGWWINGARNANGSSPQIYFSHSGGYGQHINTYNTDGSIYALQIHNNSSEIFGVYNDGQVRISSQLRIGSGSNDGYFYSDSNGRTAFAGGDFYIQDSVSNYYNYATNQYIGASSGDNIYFRGNTMSGDSWTLTGAGSFKAGSNITVGSNSAQTSAGQLAIYSSGNPYMSWHNGSAARAGYIQHIAAQDRFYFGEVSYTESLGSFRAPIFYDVDNTNYYVDPASTTNLNILNVNSSIIMNDNQLFRQEGYFTTNTSGQNTNGSATHYSFGYQIAGAWSHPYPDLVVGYHTGMRFGGHTSYGGCRFYADHPKSSTSILFSVGNGDGHVRATNNIYAYTSDKRLKENFRPIENAVDKIKLINGLIFDWRKDMMDKHDFIPDQEKDDAGLIAQEVQKVMPAAIRRAPFDHDLTAPNQSKSGEEFLTVQYEKMVPLLVEAIKEQQKQIDELKKLLEEKE